MMLKIMLTCATGVSSRNFAQKIQWELKQMFIHVQLIL